MQSSFLLLPVQLALHPLRALQRVGSLSALALFSPSGVPTAGTTAPPADLAGAALPHPSPRLSHGVQHTGFWDSKKG